MNKTFFVTLIIILVISASILFWSFYKPSFISSFISSIVSSISSFLSYSPAITQTLTYPSDRWERFWYVKSTGAYLGSDQNQTSPTFDNNWSTGIVTYKGGCNGADINQDGRVDGGDLALFGGFWNKNCTSPDWCNNVDMNKDGIVDGGDLALFGGNNGRTDCGWKDDVMFSSSRTINFPTAGTYTFTVGSDDGVKLWVDDVLKIDKWVDRSYTLDSVILNNLTVGNHTFRIDWYENEEAARVSFNYSQAITPPSLTYPSDRWERFWYVKSTGAYLGSDQNQTSPTFDNNWSLGVVAYNRTDDVMFSSSRTINFPTAGTYTFTVGSDDGVKLWIDGDVRLDKWVDRSYATDSVTLNNLTAGNHTFRIDWYENGGGARVSFNYSQAITPPSLTYPSDRWERFWYVKSTGAYLGSDQNQTSPTFDNNWSLGVVAYNRTDDIMFSSSRTINFPTAGTYTFTVGSDDGVKLWIDGDVRLDKWVDRPYTTDSITLTNFAAGNHTFRIDWYENGGGARVSFNYLINTCSDGTPYGSCSATKPKYCSNGTLINGCGTPYNCGCPSGQSCNTTTQACYTPVQTCSDGTVYSSCSTTKPKYCDNGILVDKCTTCGCSFGVCDLTSNKCEINKLTMAFGSVLTPPENRTYIASHFDTVVCNFSLDCATLKYKNPNITLFGYLDAIGVYEADYPEEWYMHDVYGKKMKHQTYGWYLMDISSSGWRNYFASRAATYLSYSPEYSGIFADDVWEWLAWHNTLWGTSVPASIQANWHNWMIGFLTTVKTALGSKILIINSNDPSDSDYLNASDGANWEGFQHWNASWTPGVGTSDLQTLNSITGRGKYALVNSGNTSPNYNIFMFSFCSFLLAAGPNSSFGWYDAGTSDIAYTVITNTIYPERDYILGNPLGAYYTSGGLYKREFENYTVSVNFSSKVGTLTPK